MNREMTATVYILENEQVLLIYHKKLQKWLPPGGHIESNELPSEGAIREAKEETGLDIALIPQENIWIEPRWNGRSFERPYMCLLEHIPEHNGHPAHEHIDLIYLGRPIGGRLKENGDETDGLKWFSLEEIEWLEREIEIFDETYRVISHLIKNKSVPSCLTYERV
ncbi:MAG: NUDIX domain-containing protein [Chlamydiales bacterium]|nr:NUDIX domain-containing protein [Chlamydiales bacterium]